MDMAIFGAILASGLAYRASDSLLKSFGQKKIIPISTEPPVPSKNRIFSPFTDIHYVLINDIARPKFSTIEILLNEIKFKIVKKPYINNYYTGYVVECDWNNTLELMYDENENKQIRSNLRKTYKLDLFSDELRNSPNFQSYLIQLVKIDVWNYYCNKYPSFFKHYAIMGVNQIEHERLQ